MLGTPGLSSNAVGRSAVDKTTFQASDALVLS